MADSLALSGRQAFETLFLQGWRSLRFGLGLLGAYTATHVLGVLWSRRYLPPGPFPLPIIGNFHQLKPLPHRALQEFHRQYGPLITIYMGSRLTVVLGSPEVVKQTHKDQGDRFTHRVLTDFARISLHADEEGGKNVALAGGKYWIKARRIFVQELMSKKFITTHAVPKIEEENWSTVDAIRELGGKPFDPHFYLQRLSLNIVFRLTYSLRFGRDEITQENSKFQELMGVINTVVKIGGTNVMANYIPILKIFNFGLKRRQIETVAKRDKVLFQMLEEHKRDLNPAKPRDFLDVLLTRQKAEGLSDREVMLIAWECITAGTDTTSATMHWMTLLLTNHPEIQRKAQEEIDRVTGGRPVMLDDQPKLRYTDAVIKETMRLQPVVPMMVPYRTVENIYVTSEGCQYCIPRDSQVLVNGFNMQRDPKNWRDPDTFDPERFVTGPDSDIEIRGSDAASDPHHLKFLPLGTGRRACAGYALAKAELFLQGATLMQSFEWKPPPGVSKIPMGESFGIAVSPNHFEVCARYRSEAVTAPLQTGGLR
ncbi:unnamed protein product [Polarella glacialis]|uniref:Cytochrome P450 n=1 Tax=Polarella glacialis TaxID=89957 RepID=A0A813ILD7_POLGL|nr:unnamed protein product [Polarella glacialis]CAE8712807.1 unnamed protein product [Polarella glacialis]